MTASDLTENVPNWMDTLNRNFTISVKCCRSRRFFFCVNSTRSVHPLKTTNQQQASGGGSQSPILGHHAKNTVHFSFFFNLADFI